MPWLKTLHVFSVFLWVSGLLLVSRALAVQVRETVDVQRRMGALSSRLYWASTFPGLVLSWALGLWMLARRPDLLDAEVWGPFFHVKLGLVLVLTVLTVVLQRRMGRVRKDPGTHHEPGPFMAVHGISGLLLLGVLYALYVMGGR
ncbi:MAG: CopD family protein [Myxococcota bacterium]